MKNNYSEKTDFYSMKAIILQSVAIFTTEICKLIFIDSISLFSLECQLNFNHQMKTFRIRWKYKSR